MVGITRSKVISHVFLFNPLHYWFDSPLYISYIVIFHFIPFLFVKPTYIFPLTHRSNLEITIVNRYLATIWDDSLYQSLPSFIGIPTQNFHITRPTHSFQLILYWKKSRQVAFPHPADASGGSTAWAGLAVHPLATWFQQQKCCFWSIYVSIWLMICNQPK